jgi:carbon-monoxide dehydrogenase small subunit
MKRELNIVVNGESYNFFIEPKTLLVQVIREMLGMKGTHQACDSSSCAACTVIVDGKAVKSCSILALQVNGKRVTTMKQRTELHQFRLLLVGLCGFCTSGQIMAPCFWINPDRQGRNKGTDGRPSPVAPGTT